MQELIEKGALGQKTNSVGFYKKDKDAKGNTVILAYRPESKTYVEQQVKTFPWEADTDKERDTVKRIQIILKHKDEGAQLVWRTLRDTFSYSALLVEDIAGGNIQAVDNALSWGFGWEMGPFALWQALGYDEVLQRLSDEKVKLPSWAKPGIKFYDVVPGSKEWTSQGGPLSELKVQGGQTKLVALPKPDYAYRLPSRENKDDKRTVISNRSASLVDIGDGMHRDLFVPHRIGAPEHVNNQRIKGRPLLRFKDPRHRHGLERRAGQTIDRLRRKCHQLPAA
jgi:3-hydroxyacyl-CoA dehydrogenase